MNSKGNAEPLNAEILRKVIREEVKHLATQESVDQLAISVASGFEDTASREDIDKVNSQLVTIKQKQLDNHTSVLAYDRKVMSLEKRVTVLEGAD